MHQPAGVSCTSDVLNLDSSHTHTLPALSAEPRLIAMLSMLVIPIPAAWGREKSGSFSRSGKPCLSEVWLQDTRTSVESFWRVLYRSTEPISTHVLGHGIQTVLQMKDYALVKQRGSFRKCRRQRCSRPGKGIIIAMFIFMSLDRYKEAR